MRKCALSMICVVLLVPAVHAAIIDGPLNFNGHYYYVLSPQTWHEAEAEAVTLGGHLVAVNDQAEQDFVYSIISDAVGAHWIGFTDEDTEGIWVWTNGDPITYTNWNVPYEPNNHLGIEHSGAIEVAWGGKWNDLPGDRIWRGVVETEVAPQTTYSILRGEDPWSLSEVDIAPIPWTDLDPVLTPPYPDLLFYLAEDLSRIHMNKEPETVTLSAAWPSPAGPANSDPWIVDHHDELGLMQPRVLVLNFSNDTSMEDARLLTDRFVGAIAESSRWHGSDDPLSPVFLDYKVDKIVDLRDDPPEATCDGNSTRYPRVPGWVAGNNFVYAALYDEPFTTYLGYPDPDQPGQFLPLIELVERGIIHELWFFANHGSCGAPYETIELKQYYDAAFQKTGHGPAGNGHDFGMPWIGRSFRITFINPHRGIGCAMENLGHALEGMMWHDAIPYYTGYLREFGGFDLNTRWGLPFESFYSYSPSDSNSFPDSTTLVAHFQGTDYPIEDYCAIGGNVHFTPNGRSHYDLGNFAPVMSTIRSYRMGNGPDGDDLAEVFTGNEFQLFYSLAPDCMGPWLIYWRQNMPGAGNDAKDDDGNPMKNWWPFLFY